MADLQNWWHHSLLDLHPLFQSLSPVILYLALLIAIVALLSILHFFFLSLIHLRKTVMLTT